MGEEEKMTFVLPLADFIIEKDGGKFHRKYCRGSDFILGIFLHYF